MNACLGCASVFGISAFTEHLDTCVSSDSPISVAFVILLTHTEGRRPIGTDFVRETTRLLYDK